MRMLSLLVGFPIEAEFCRLATAAFQCGNAARRV